MHDAAWRAVERTGAVLVTLIELAPILIEQITDDYERERVGIEWADGDLDTEVSIACQGLVQIAFARAGWRPPPEVLWGTN